MLRQLFITPFISFIISSKWGAAINKVIPGHKLEVLLDNSYNYIQTLKTFRRKKMPSSNIHSTEYLSIYISIELWPMKASPRNSSKTHNNLYYIE